MLVAQLRYRLLLGGLCLAVFSTSVPTFSQDTIAHNRTLLDATSPFEDIAEFAIAKNDSAIQKQLLIADRNMARLPSAMTADRFSVFESQFKKLKTLAAEKSYREAADTSVELFRQLIECLDASKLEVPQEVSLLDYAGFKIHVLTATEIPDWSAIEKTTEDAGKWWSELKGKVTNKKLKDAVNSTIRGLQEATRSKNLPMVNFAAQLDLDLVDLLETEFEK